MALIGALRVLAAAITAVSPSPTPSAPPQIVHVVTSDRSETTLRNTIRTTFVVTADEIARRGYRTVGDALADVPGVELFNYGPIGASVDYGIRGSSSAQVLVLMDGVPITGSLANSVTLGNLSTVGVRRIEVVEGGGSTLYGTGAIGGIINVITDRTQHPHVLARYGTFDDREVQVGAAGFSFDRTVATNTYALPPSLDPFAGTPNPTTRDNGDYRATTVRYDGSRTLRAIRASLHATAESDDIGAAGFFPYLSSTSREHDVNDGVTLSLARDRAQSTTELQLFGSSQRIGFACNAATDANCYTAVPSLNTEGRVGLGLRSTVHGARERLIYGVDLARGSVRSDDGNGDITNNALAQSAAYAQESIETRTGEFSFGLRGERDGALGGEFSPSVGWRNDFGAFTLRANAASAFRAPNASELYFPGYGNPQLHPERAQVGDLTLTDHRALGGISLGWFTNRTNDLIVATPVGAIYVPLNVDHAFIQGFTLDASTLPLHGITTRLALTDLYR
ncbi:MAG: TonB-dependent receptor, partial [bacterium]|nr:TonB-dependent receptor [bacterium]